MPKSQKSKHKNGKAKPRSGKQKPARPRTQSAVDTVYLDAIISQYEQSQINGGPKYAEESTPP